MTIDPEHAPMILQRIAQALGIPVHSLCADSDAVMDTHGRANACLRLWTQLRTEDQRRRALAALQALVDEPGDGSDP